MDALRQLQALGINQIRIGDQFYAIVDVLAALENPSQARMMLATLMASVNAGVTVYFAGREPHGGQRRMGADQRRIPNGIGWLTGRRLC